MIMRDILAQNREVFENGEFDAAAALKLVENPGELFKMENLVRLESFLAKNVFSLPSEVVGKLTESLAQEDVAYAAVELENFREFRSRLENISNYLDSVSVAVRLGSRLGAKVLQKDIATAMANENFQALGSIQAAWSVEETKLPSIFGRSLLQYIMDQPLVEKQALLERRELIDLISKDEGGVGQMAAALRVSLEEKEDDTSERLTTVPGAAQAA